MICAVSELVCDTVVAVNKSDNIGRAFLDRKICAKQIHISLFAVTA